MASSTVAALSQLNPVTGTKYVDIAALSLSGSLVPSVPTKVMLRYDPPKMTIVYHFEQNSQELFYHDINLDRRMLFEKSSDDMVSFLYLTEAYYFNPKQIKRPQLMRLIQMMQEHQSKENIQNTNDQFPTLNHSYRQEFLNIKDNHYQEEAATAPGTSNNSSSSLQQTQHQQNQQQQSYSIGMRNGNLFEQQRKRFLSGGQIIGDLTQQNNSNTNSQNNNQAPAAISPMLPGTDLISLSTQGSKRNPLLNRGRGFDELPIQGQLQHPHHHPSATAVAHPQSDMMIHDMLQKNNSLLKQQSGTEQPVKPRIRAGPISDPHFLTSTTSTNFASVTANSPIERGGSNAPFKANFGMGSMLQNQNQSAPASDHIFPPESNPIEPSPQELKESSSDAGGQQEGQDQEQLAGMMEDEEYNSESIVYTLDGVVMRTIQIEGEDQQYLMDPENKIYDMQGNFIGTANTQGLDMDEEGQNQDHNPLDDHQEVEAVQENMDQIDLDNSQEGVSP